MYTETQKMDHWLFRGALLLGPVFILGVCLWMFFTGESQTIIPKESGIWIAFLICVVPLIVMWRFKLHTEIDETGIRLKFWPFPAKEFQWEEIEKAYLREYRPLAEYGGWGVRWGSAGKAYNTKGNQGLQLVLNTGGNNKFLIGTQEAERLAGYLESIGKLSLSEAASA